jgi:hypothetical protein
MNNRIKELWNRSNHDEEVFAELIVGECFVKLTPYLDDQFIDDIESELKEHFGVEE